jgi:hypothetical protein
LSGAMPEQITSPVFGCPLHTSSCLN